MSPIVKRYRIAIVVQGRFHMFDIARELAKLGHDVTVFTNYPKYIVKKFDLDSARAVTNPWQGLTSRVLARLFPKDRSGKIDRHNNSSFARWAAIAVPRLGPFDFVFCMSGVARELFQTLGNCTTKILHRGSVHIRSQYDILDAEERDGGGFVQKPSVWMMEREESEYTMADQVQVFAQFSKSSFLARGFDPARLAVVPLGVRVQSLRPAIEVIAERLARLQRGEPLRVVCVGNVSRQKGVRTWKQFFGLPERAQVAVRFVGEITPDAREFIKDFPSSVEFIGKVPQAELPNHYAWADLFVLPTIQDGFSVVVAQALAACVPVVTTTANGAADIVVPNETGWIVPPQRADLLNEILAMLSMDPSHLRNAVKKLCNANLDMDWAECARQAVQQAERVRTTS